MAANDDRLAPAIERLDEFLRREMRPGTAVGMAVALTDRNGLVWEGSYGFADLSARTPLEPGTLLEIGSIGKTFTALALLRLRDEGRIDLDAPVTRYLPWFRVGDEQAAITLHHLLNHTAGITAGIDGTPEARSEVWMLRETSVGGPPGERFHYSNVGYKVLGLVMEQVTGEPYRETIGRLLPLIGMDASLPAITHEMRSRLAVGYAPLYDDRPQHPNHPLVPATWLETDTADGSIAAPAADLAAFLRLLLNRGVGPNGRVLSEDGFALMTRRAGAAGEARYGYGVIVAEDDEGRQIGHTGGMVGYLASIRGDPDAGVGVAAMCSGPGDPFEVTRVALDLLRAAVAGRELPPLPEADDPWQVPDGADYGGRYLAGTGGATKTFTVSAENDGLRLQDDEATAPLVRHWSGGFVVERPAFDRFALRFDRAEDGRIVGATHGGDRYAKDGTVIPSAMGELPTEWSAYPGRYRSFNPWVPMFVVVARGEQLWLLFPAGEPDGFEEEQPLVPLGEGLFRAGEDPALPERVRFDTVVEGVALRATLSGAEYWRMSVE